LAGRGRWTPPLWCPVLAPNRWTPRPWWPDGAGRDRWTPPSWWLVLAAAPAAGRQGHVPAPQPPSNSGLPVSRPDAPGLFDQPQRPAQAAERQ
jgi:hypothetical protein